MPMPKVKPEEKICPVCGTVFEVGGRGRPRRDQRFCNQRCNAYARVRQHRVRQMTPTEAAYLAGLIDGEGSIIAAKQREHRTTWRLQVSSTTPVLLNWCIQTTGVGTIVTHRSGHPLHADSKWWQCYSWNAVDILRQIEPYMVLKKDKAMRVIEDMSKIERLNLKE